MTAVRASPNIFTVPPTRPFLDAVAEAIVGGHLPRLGGRPPRIEELSGYTLILPTKRSVKAMQEALLRASPRRALILPRIRAIGVGEEDAALIEGLAEPATQYAPLDLPPAVGGLERLMVLAQLVAAWSRGTMARAAAAPGGDKRERLRQDASPAQALQLARELARLVDLVEVEQRSLEGLETLVPESLAAHWGETIEFLRIVREFWPAFLAERQLLSPTARRNAVVEAEAARVALLAAKGPVIVAGVTGSVPATARLMRAVAAEANGAIVVPALDRALDEESFAAIVPHHPEHPQFGLARLLAEFGVGRQDVRWLAGIGPKPAEAARLAFLSEALRPAQTTAAWRDMASPAKAGEVAKALSGFERIDAPTPDAEAAAIALILREAIETPGRTAALVTPDRLLGRRVAAELERWGLRVDDSAGRPFAKTVPGAFLDLVLAALQSDFAPVETMALLKHPLTRLGLPVGPARRAARSLELAVFRRDYLGSGIGGIETALARARDEIAARKAFHPVLRRLTAADAEAAADLLARLKAAYAPLAELARSGEPAKLGALAAAHAAVAEAIAAREGETDGAMPLLWTGEAGDMAGELFRGLSDPDLPAMSLAAADYPDLYRGIVADLAVRLSVSLHPRLFIWGPFEARLMQPDIVVLGGLNEGVWPEAADPGPWLNRQMRAALGLPSPEERIGQEAHDFYSLLGAPHVVLTRSAKADGNPTVPSRWLMRIDALLSALGHDVSPGNAKPWLAWAETRNRIERGRPAAAPAPAPAVALRPRSLSVSDVETWIGNPYAIFARRILRLEPLKALAAEPDPALRGSLIHQALHRFTGLFPGPLPPATADQLAAILDGLLSEHAAHPRVAAFWRPRFRRFAEWFAETEPARRQGVNEILAEVSGSMAFSAPAGEFTLTARADRIDMKSGGLVITDYKTGSAPPSTAVATHIAPQLPLEAAIAAAGGFAGVGAAPTLLMRFIEAKGGEPPGFECDVKGDAGALGRAAAAGLSRLVARYDDAATPYRAVRRRSFKYDYDDYAHLARVAEWSGAAEDD